MPTARPTAALIFSLYLASATAARAQEPTEGPPQRPSDAAPPTAPCIDDELARKGVQKRTFLKRHRVELIAQGGLYASDLLSSTYAYGGTLAGWITEGFGLEVSFHVTPVALDVDESLTGFFGDSRFIADTGFLALASALWAPIHFKVRTGGGSILHGDIELSLGGGRLFSETTQGLAFQGGALAELFLTDWLSFRLDLKDVLLVQEVVATTRLTNNVTVLAGIGLWFPFGF